MTMTQGVDVSSLLVNYGFFSHGDVTLAQSYIVHISLFEAFLIFQNNVLNSTLTSLIIMMEKYKQW
jgi:hypothetical protein